MFPEAPTQRSDHAGNSEVTDPFYRQIVEALSGHLDWKVFQRCMGDLLRDDLPGLVPISGSDDQGMDGAFGADGVLVCTTDEKVSRNLRRSMDSILSSGRRRRKLALATSQALSPRQRGNFEQGAREKGFTLPHIFDQRAIADRLYHSSRWRRDLLQLSGTPSALSMVPRTRRPLLEIELIGRADDVKWLRETSGDRLITGQPGSGKTCLLHQLVREGWGLFLAGHDQTDIANSVRSQKPDVIIVDDAHGEPKQLELLRHLRNELDAEFDIVATTWTGQKSEVAEALGSLPTTKIRRLELLTREQILQVYQLAGIRVPDAAMRVLIDQAARKPGLAITLATLWLQGSWKEVLEGRALTRSLMTQLKKLVGPESTDLLAALGLAGDRGMPLEVAGEYLGVTRQKGRELALGLAAGGVLSEMGERNVAVWPRELRWALVGQVFFQDSMTHDYRQLLDKVPSLESATETLLGAAHRGAKIPRKALQSLVARSTSADVWRSFAMLGAHQAEWALEQYPGDMVYLAGAALSVAAHSTVSLLLERAAVAEGPLHSQPYHPLRLLEDWVRDVQVPPSEVLRRRRILIRLARKYLQNGGNRSVGVHALLLTLSPKMEGAGPNPVQPAGIKYQWGLLPREQLEELGHLWHEVRGEIRDIDAAIWQELKSILWGWIHPESVAASEDVPRDHKQMMRTFAAKALQDIAPMIAGRPGLTAGLKRLAARFDLRLPLDSDHTFEFLYPENYPLEDSLENATSEDLCELADTWAAERTPEAVASQLALYEAEANDISVQLWQPRIHELCKLLADSTERPDQWLQAFLDQGLDGVAVNPFLDRLMQIQPGDLDHLLKRCLQSEDHSEFAIELILKSSAVPLDLLESVIDKTTPERTMALAATRELQIATLKAFMHCKHSEFALAAAIGEWYGNPRGQVRQELLSSWEATILSTGKPSHEEFRHFLGDILANDSTLAFRWLQRRLNTDDLALLLQDDLAFDRALKALDSDQRADLLRELEETPCLGSLLRRLIDRNAQLYGQLLSMRNLEKYHLDPLTHKPDSDWLELALRALGAGLDPEKIAAASFVLDPFSPDGRVIWGAERGLVDRWIEHDRAFAALENHPIEDLRLVAAHGRRMAGERIEALEDKIKRDELMGR